MRRTLTFVHKLIGSRTQDGSYFVYWQTLCVNLKNDIFVKNPRKKSNRTKTEISIEIGKDHCNYNKIEGREIKINNCVRHSNAFFLINGFYYDSANYNHIIFIIHINLLSDGVH